MELVVIQKQGNLILNNQNPYRYVSRAEYRQSLLSEDVINISVESKTSLQFNIGDRIEYANRYFILNIAPKIKREQGFYSYDLVFEGVQYSLRNKIYFNLDKTGFQTSADFPLTGEIDIFLKVLVDNINSISDTRWILGEYPSNTDTKTLTFSNENCLAVLQKICQEWDTEFEMQENIVAKTITLNVKKIGNPLPYTFEYGQGNGLYTLTRDNEANDVITRLYAYGSTENIPNNYRDYSEKLRMPQSQGDYIQDDEKVRLFGLKEAVKTFDEVKPTFKGIISRVGAFDDYTKTQEIEVQNMDFDLNERAEDGSTKWLIPDTPVKLHFNKGNLAGYSFEVMKNEGYKHSTKVFKVKQFTDERGQKFPDIGTIFEFAVGDEFTLIDLVMPDVYLTRAENKLLEEAKKEYEKVSRNNVKYSLDIDPLFLKSKGDESTTFFRIGDYIHLVDKELNIDKNSRIVNISRDLLNPFDFKIDIADTYEISFTQSVLQDIRDTKKIVVEEKVKNREQYRRGYKNLEELKNSVFDTEGYFDPGNIKPNSIEVNMISVGAKNQLFTLENITLNPNVNGNPNKVSITTGRLVHLSIEDNVKEWTMIGIDTFDLLDIVYYVYAKVERNGVLGNWHITPEKIKFDQYSEHYYFLCYVLYTPKNGKRDAQALYGNTLIHGGQVTTGRIQSIDGRTFFDLDTGEIRGKIEFTADSPALTQVQGMVDDISVGGRNLMLNSKLFVMAGNDRRNSNNTNAGRIIVNASNGEWNAYSWAQLSESHKVGDIITFSMDIKSSIDCGIDFNYFPYYLNNYFVKRESFLAGQWKRVFLTGTIQSIDGNRHLIGLRGSNMASAVVEFRNAKIEKGNKPTDWTPAPEDVESQINKNDALITSLIHKTDFLHSTTIQGNVVASGTMLVGNSLGANAGLTGLGTDDDVFLWGGESFENRTDAKVWFKRNGHFRLKTTQGLEFNSETGYIGGRYANGNLAFKLSMENGFPEFAFYKDDGTKVYSLGQNGIYYIREIDESFTLYRLLNLNSNEGISDINVFKNDIKDAIFERNNSYFVGSNTDAYLYQVGQNVYSESNRQYEGYKSTKNKYNNIPDGWYAVSGPVMEKDNGQHSSKVALVRVLRLSSGKVVQEGIVEIYNYTVLS